MRYPKISRLVEITISSKFNFIKFYKIVFFKKLYRIKLFWSLVASIRIISEQRIPCV